MIFEKIRERLITDKRIGRTSLEAFCEILKDVEAEYDGGWIPCSERLPEESGEYLTWVRYDGNEFRAIDEIDCDGMTKKWNCSFEYEVIAWQPLPQPPKGE